MSRAVHAIYIPASQLPYACGESPIGATIKERFEDFRVSETLGFALDGAGQHLWLRIEKVDLTTDDVAKSLAKAAAVNRRDVGYAGLKDRHAITSQWFSVDVGEQREPALAGLLPNGCQILEVARHTKKLRRGVLSGNSFAIRLRNLSGPVEKIDARVAQIRAHGVPNYFGEQRFGSDGENVAPAYRLLRGEHSVRNRHRRGIYYSCARSLLFNRVLAKRVSLGNWDRPIAGDVMMLDGSRSRFHVGEPDGALTERAHQMDIHPTGPLWGKGESIPSGEAGLLETEVLGEFGEWCEGLENAGLEHDRRALRVAVRDLAYQRLDSGDLRVTFSLPPGAYATTVLRELVKFSTTRRRHPSLHQSDARC